MFLAGAATGSVMGRCGFGLLNGLASSISCALKVSLMPSIASSNSASGLCLVEACFEVSKLILKAVSLA